MARERLFTLQPMVGKQNGRKKERYAKIGSNGVAYVSRQVVEDCLMREGDSVPDMAFITLYSDASKRVIGFKLEEHAPLPLAKNQKFINVDQKARVIKVDVKLFLNTVRTKVTLPTGRLEVKDYEDEIWGKVKYFTF